MPNAIDPFQLMRYHHLIFGYRGTITNDLITSVLQLTELKLKEMNIPLRKKKAIINILIECLQNILYHGDQVVEDNQSGSQCIFLIGKHGDDFFIRFGNYVQHRLVGALRAKLDHMTALGAEEIYNLYMDVLDRGRISEKGGAGLGILRVMKDSGQNVVYDFVVDETQRTFFSMEIKIIG